MNKNKSEIIRIYGVTLASKDSRTRAYGHGRTKIDDVLDVFVEYVDYFIDDLIILIKQQNLDKKIINKLKKEQGK